LDGENFWGKLVEQLRKEQAISQRQLAHGAQVNRATLRRIESGTSSGEIDTMEKIFAYLGYELEAMSSASKAQLLERRAAMAPEDEELRSKMAARKLLGLRPSIL
jgi:transcriptional regulator with XRE-family HTH domain